jgi:hypothetical protein
MVSEGSTSSVIVLPCIIQPVRWIVSYTCTREGDARPATGLPACLPAGGRGGGRAPPLTVRVLTNICMVLLLLLGPSLRASGVRDVGRFQPAIHPTTQGAETRALYVLDDERGAARTPPSLYYKQCIKSGIMYRECEHKSLHCLAGGLGFGSQRRANGAHHDSAGCT